MWKYGNIPYQLARNRSSRNTAFNLEIALVRNRRNYRRTAQAPFILFAEAGFEGESERKD